MPQQSNRSPLLLQATSYAEEKTNKRYCFEVATPESTFYMYAETEKEKDEWIGAIGRAIVRFSSAFTGDDGFEEEGS